MIATRIVTALGMQKTLAVFLDSTLLGMTLWALGAGLLPVMGAGILFWGLGFAATNSMQQARLVAAAPDLASASVGLNTSVLYTGQAIGSGIGGISVRHRLSAQPSAMSASPSCAWPALALVAADLGAAARQRCGAAALSAARAISASTCGSMRATTMA